VQNRGSPETIALALKEAALLDKLPVLEDNVLKVFLVGSRDWVEGEFCYDALYVGLRGFVYPELERVDITLVDPEVTTAALVPFPAGHYTITKVNGKLQDAYPGDLPAASLFVVFQPGLSENCNSWSVRFTRWFTAIF